MIRPLCAALALATLAACGADGPPIPPSDPPPQQQGVITITGQGRAGVTASNG